MTWEQKVEHFKETHNHSDWDDDWFRDEEEKPCCLICGEEVRDFDLNYEDVLVCKECEWLFANPVNFLDYLIENESLELFWYGWHYGLDDYEPTDNRHVIRDIAALYMMHYDADVAVGEHNIRDEMDMYLLDQNDRKYFVEWLGENADKNLTEVNE